MNTRTPLIVSLALAVAMAMFALYAASLLPDGAQLPTHWNAAGEVDDTSPALFALLMPTGVVIFLAALFAIIPRIEPLQNQLEASGDLLKAVWYAMLALMVLVQGMIAMPAFGREPSADLVIVGVGVLFIVIGNMLPKSRPGFFVGIRTPWTLTDTDNWIATHRLGGKLFMAAGAAILLTVILPFAPSTRAGIMIGATVAAALLPAIYSWFFWHRSRKEGETGR
ncbi:DUF1648 domain-containing protein [Erythrobacter sp. 3-20A1M]|uniref:SdpI family protein n=1 Tax=Erythrobacter sp. 3-20A1M TaxID=2653850 RepID=UPI001BFBFA1C|nr:SdpI family protein [Erythrobacter sp. 3-20A1M]QWC56081.1 DUF1648 domain-containing protein [Erythrobacter sp. 3-20A1M]